MDRKKFFALLSHLTAGDITQVQLAYWLAKNAHREQERDSGERYFEHPRDVAVTLISHGVNDRDSVIMALLHDVVEDTNTPFPVIINLFGHEMWESLFLLSKVTPVFDPVTGQIFGRYKKTDDEYYAELMKAKVSVKSVKCGDRLRNLQQMGESWPLEKQITYARHTIEKVLPLAQATDLWFYEVLKAEVDKILAQVH
jgi:(p)ppGpp synthase/HD superfamily hydrolase